MATVRVSFTLNYGSKLSQAETRPSIFCYFSDQISGKGVDVPVPVNNATKQINVTLEGTFDSRKPLPIDTEVGFYATCWRDNDYGVPCQVSAGMGTLSLNELVNGPGRQFSSDVPLKSNSVGGRERGRLRIISAKKLVNIDSRIRWESSSAIISSPFRPIGGNGINAMSPLPIEQEMVSYIRAVMQTEMAFPNTYPETSNVRIPIYFGDVGMMRPDTPLPAAAFFLCKTPESNTRFWENSLKVILAREGCVVQDFDRMPLERQASVMTDVVCAVIHAMDYIGDIDDLNERCIQPMPGFIGSGIDRPYDPTRVVGCERFGDALRDGNGDCEDFALAIGGQIFSALIKHDFKGHPQLTRVQEIANQYIAFMTLDSVTAAAMKAEGQKRVLGAHIKCTFISAAYAKECIDRGVSNMSTSKIGLEAFLHGKPKFAADVIGASIETGKNMAFKPFASWAKDLPTVIGEGTGMFQPYGVNVDPIAEERADVYRMPSLGFAKKTIVHKPMAHSGFFVGSMVGFTNYWFEMGLNIGGAWIGHANNGQFQRGVSFEELVTKSDKISILPHPAFSQPCMDWMRRATSIRVPPRDLLLTDEGIARQPEREPTIDALIEFTDSFGRGSGKRAQPPAPVYLKTIQLTAANVAAIKNDIHRNSHITHLTYTCEHLTDWMHMYRVGFHEDPL